MYTKLNSVTSKKTVIFIVTAMRGSNIRVKFFQFLFASPGTPIHSSSFPYLIINRSQALKLCQFLWTDNIYITVSVENGNVTTLIRICVWAVCFWFSWSVWISKKINCLFNKQFSVYIKINMWSEIGKNRNTRNVEYAGLFSYRWRQCIYLRFS